MASDITKTILYSIYENQRFYPVIGWSKKLLPTDPLRWSNLDRTPCDKREDVMPDAGFKWAGEWEVQTSDETDRDGWQYAIDFMHKFGKSSTALCTRRRLWTRNMERDTLSTGGAPSKKATSSGSGASLAATIGEEKKRKKRETDEQVEWVFCFENQRYYPIAGWSANLLPTDRSNWSDEDGKKRRTKDDCDSSLVSGWRWMSEWTVVVSDGGASVKRTDLEGWSYAVDFAQADYAASKGVLHSVRRRKWARKKTTIPDLRQWGVVLTRVPSSPVAGYASPIPIILQKLKKSLVAHGGLDVVNIFRNTVDEKEVAQLKDDCNRDTFTDCSLPDVVATAIRQFFQMLPQPLLSMEGPSSGNGDSGTGSGSSDTAVGEILTSLPEPQKSLMEWLLDLCVRICSNSAVNRITPDLIAAIFAPTLMGPSSSPTATAAGGTAASSAAGAGKVRAASDRLLTKFFAQAVEYRKKKTSSYIYMRSAIRD